jgi:class 3 adenylate cyclase/predicted ATPase
MVTCPSCGEENPAKFRLCGFCGAALRVAAEQAEKRKLVTVVFSDLKGSTSLGEALDPEAVREVLSRYFDTMKAELLRHGGTIEKYIGDAIMAVFGLPVVHEDDALRAVRAAAGMRRALAQLNADLERRYGVQLENRTGVHSGEVVTGDATVAQRLVTGDVVNTAARLEQAAPANEVLIGELTRSLIGDAAELEAVEPLELKGKAERVKAWRLGAVREQGQVSRRGDAPLVGREQELVRLGEAFSEVLASGAPSLVTIVAEAGMGKTRLLHEFTSSLADRAEVLRGRCLPYGEGITFWPLVEIVRAAADIGEDAPAAEARARLLSLAGDRDVAARLASAIGLTTAPFPLAEVDWAARRLLEGLAEDRPVVAIIDDLHWAEVAFLELLQHVHEQGQAPILLLATARPDLLETQPDWAERPRSDVITLRPLGSDDVGHVVEALLGSSGAPRDVLAQVVQAAEGNPLYVEQYVSMLLDSGALRPTDGGWIKADESGELTIPPGITALLTARLDTLDAETRAVVEPASVVGLQFPEAAVASMVPEGVRAAVPDRLEVLARRQFVRRTESRDLLDGDHRFGHILIRDATYGTLLKRARAALHRGFVSWADRVNAERDRVVEFEEILGWHLEQAYRYLDELGPLDEDGVALGKEGGTRLSNAGRRAHARGDLHAASSLFRRATAMLEAHDPSRLALLPELAEVLMETGEFDEARAIIVSAAEAADELFDDRLATHAVLVGYLIDYYAGNDEVSYEQMLAAAEAAIPVFERSDDHAGIARAWRLISYVHGMALRFGEMTAACERLIEHARLAGDERLAARGAIGYAQAALYGPTPVAEAIARSEAIIGAAEDDRRTRALVSSSLAELYAMDGRIDRAREAYSGARGAFEELGNRLLAASVSVSSYRVELLAGDPGAARAELSRDRAALEALGELQLRATVTALLASLEADNGALDDAERLADEARDIAEEDDVDAQAAWRIAKARVLAERGDHGPADELSVAAVELLRPNDSGVLLADALMQRAAVLARADRDGEAAALREEAVRRYVRKGDRVSADRARSLLGVG